MSDDDTPLPVTVAVTTPAPLPDGFSIPAVVALASDLAMGMLEEAAILRKHGITPAQYATLQQVPYFTKVVDQMAREWHAPTNSQQRLATQTSLGLERVLPDVIARVTAKNEELTGIAQIIKILADIAGASGNARAVAPPGEKFKITINLGADTEIYNKTKPIVTVEAAAPSSDPAPVQPLSEGLSALLAIQTEPEKA